MKDGVKVETVLMRYDYGNLHVSSQVDVIWVVLLCFRITFKNRDLTPSELIGQLLVMESLMEGEKM